MLLVESYPVHFLLVWYKLISFNIELRAHTHTHIRIYINIRLKLHIFTQVLNRESFFLRNYSIVLFILKEKYKILEHIGSGETLIITGTVLFSSGDKKYCFFFKANITSLLKAIIFALDFCLVHVLHFTLGRWTLMSLKESILWNKITE